MQRLIQVILIQKRVHYYMKVTHYFWGLGTFDLTYDHDKMKKLPDEGFFYIKK